MQFIERTNDLFVQGQLGPHIYGLSAAESLPYEEPPFSHSKKAHFESEGFDEDLTRGELQQ